MIVASLWCSHRACAENFSRSLPPKIRHQEVSKCVRPYRPRDKAKVEVGVQIRRALDHCSPASSEVFRLEDVNRAIRELLERLNQRPFRKREGSRSLPAERFDMSQQPLTELPSLPPLRLMTTSEANLTCPVSSELADSPRFVSAPANCD